MEKRILILTAGYGEGHNAAARGIRDGLAAVSGGTAAVEMHDLFAETYGFVNDWVRKGYLTLINRAPRPWARFYKWLDRQEEYGSHMRWLFMVKARLSQLLLRFQPTVVASVFPAYPHLLETIFGGANPAFSAGRLHDRFDHGERHLVSLRRAICFLCLTNRRPRSSPQRACLTRRCG